MPYLSWSHGGAQRWIQLGSFLSAGGNFKIWLYYLFCDLAVRRKNRVQDFKVGILPFLIMLALIAAILLKQPDTKSFILITVTGLSMLFISGVPLKYIFGVGLTGVILLGILIYFTPYLQERVKTFINPTSDPRGSSYQIQQSFIALGSGENIRSRILLKRPKIRLSAGTAGDSIFAVLGEELGFVGASGTIFLYLLFALRGFRIANNSSDIFGRLLVSELLYW